jgi:hypothetical protein
MCHYRLPDLHHFYASLLLAQGVELKVISELFGYSSVRITGDVYAHVLSSLKNQTATVMDSILTGTKLRIPVKVTVNISKNKKGYQIGSLNLLSIKVEPRGIEPLTS